MAARWRSTTAVMVLLAALVLVSACGGGGGGNDNEPELPPPTATPQRTATGAQTPAPGATPTPQGGVTNVPTKTGTTPEPTETPGATPAATATPPGTLGTKARFTITAAEPLFGFQLAITYPIAKGSFAGSGRLVQCSTPSREIFVKNDHDDGTLELLLANAFSLAFPVIIDCTFDAGGGAGVSASELVVTGKEVTDEMGLVGDPSTLTVAIDVTS